MQAKFSIASRCLAYASIAVSCSIRRQELMVFTEGHFIIIINLERMAAAITDRLVSPFEYFATSLLSFFLLLFHQLLLIFHLVVYVDLVCDFHESVTRWPFTPLGLLHEVLTARLSFLRRMYIYEIGRDSLFIVKLEDLLFDQLEVLELRDITGAT